MSNLPDPTRLSGASVCTVLTGRKWKTTINGYKALNGTMYGCTIHGTIQEAGADDDIYDVMRELSGYLRDRNTEMAFIDSIQLTIYPPPNAPATPKDQPDPRRLLCPFCGRAPRLISTGHHRKGGWINWFTVGCDASLGGCGAHQSHRFESGAWALWNKRSNAGDPHER